MPKQVKYIDLFCGLGAFHTAFNKNSNENIEYKCVLACDIDDQVRDIYHENYNIHPLSDINEINVDEIEDFDILCAGFPCQPFSIAGKKLGFGDEGRGNLFYSILKIIDSKNPKTLILENVKNLHTIHNGETFKKIQTEIEKRGYTFSYRIINSKDYGSPQARERIFMVCDKDRLYSFIDTPVTSKTPVSSIIDYSVDTFFDYSNMYTLEPCKGNSIMKYKLINKITKKGGRQGERVYGIDSYGPTICASSGGPGAKTGLYEINGKIRTLSIKETLQMFGFGIDYKYTTLKNPKRMLYYLGNSIVVNVVDRIIKDLVEKTENDQESEH